MRRLPAGRSTTSPASLSTLRCCETAGRLTGSSRASSPTAVGDSARRSKIVRLVGSASAASWLAATYRKAMLTQLGCQGRRAAASSGAPGRLLLEREVRAVRRPVLQPHDQLLAPRPAGIGLPDVLVLVGTLGIGQRGLAGCG